MGQGKLGIDPAVLSRLVKEILEVARLNIQIAIVIGGGNLFRGASISGLGIERVTGDQMGMLATIMNALAMRDALEALGKTCWVMSALPIKGVVDGFDRRKALMHLYQQHVMIFAGGTGNPLVTTDSAASLRGIEIGADILLKGTDVDGIYSADPEHNPAAMLYTHLTYQEVLERELGVMDLAAFCQCRDHGLPIRVFNINKPGALIQVAMGSNEGTLVD